MVGSANDRAGQRHQTNAAARMPIMRCGRDREAGNEHQRCEHHPAVALCPLRASVACKVE